MMLDGFEVPMDQVKGMGERHRCADLIKHPDPARQVFRRRRPGRERFRQGLAVNQFHHKKRPPVGQFVNPKVKDLNPRTPSIASRGS
jgi:hypothetical protein